MRPLLAVILLSACSARPTSRPPTYWTKDEYIPVRGVLADGQLLAPCPIRWMVEWEGGCWTRSVEGPPCDARDVQVGSACLTPLYAR